VLCFVAITTEDSSNANIGNATQSQMSETSSQYDPSSEMDLQDIVLSQGEIDETNNNYTNLSPEQFLARTRLFVKQGNVANSIRQSPHLKSVVNAYDSIFKILKKYQNRSNPTEIDFSSINNSLKCITYASILSKSAETVSQTEYPLLKMENNKFTINNTLLHTFISSDTLEQITESTVALLHSCQSIYFYINILSLNPKYFISKKPKCNSETVMKALGLGVSTLDGYLLDKCQHLFQSMAFSVANNLPNLFLVPPHLKDACKGNRPGALGSGSATAKFMLAQLKNINKLNPMQHAMVASLQHNLDELSLLHTYLYMN